MTLGEGHVSNVSNISNSTSAGDSVRDVGSTSGSSTGVAMWQVTCWLKEMCKGMSCIGMAGLGGRYA